MARAFSDSQLVLATFNKGKLKEITEILSPYDVEILPAANLQLTAPEETGTTYEENALLKARIAAEESNLPALADDAGIEVSTLGGKPGLHTARWVKEIGSFDKAFKHIAQKVQESGDARATFVCSVALYWPDGHHEVFLAREEGTLTFPPRWRETGCNFGFDPVFCPAGLPITYTQMPHAEKNRVGHRGLALQKLLKACFESRLKKTNINLIN